MALTPDEHRLCSAFGQGRSANARDEYLSDNPHAYGSDAHAAWEAGWLEEEGPTYTVAPRAAADYRWPTLGDIWPMA